MFPLSPSGWAAVAVGILILGLGTAVKVQSSRLESCKTASEAFKAQVVAEGQAAAKEAARRDLINSTALKEAKDENAKVTADRDAKYAAYRKLLDSTRSCPLPEAPAVAGTTERTCYKSADITRAVGDFEAGLFSEFGKIEAGVPKITEQGDVARSRLIGAMKWATSIAK